MAGFNKTGVPWYAHPDLPPIRPRREIKLADEEFLQGQAKKMLAYKYVKQFIDDNWRDGDHFHIIKTGQTKHSEKTGVFHRRELVGTAWFVIVDWDDPEYRPTGLGKHKLGMFDFFHYAFKEGEDA